MPNEVNPFVDEIDEPLEDEELNPEAQVFYRRENRFFINASDNRVIRCPTCRDHMGLWELDGADYTPWERLRFLRCRGCHYTFRVPDAVRERANLAQQAQGVSQLAGTIRQYSYKPPPKFFGQSNIRLYYGIEHEVECKRAIDPNLLAAEIHSNDPKGLFYFKHDSSLMRGFEVVSHPMTLGYFNRHYPMEVARLLAETAQNYHRAHGEDNYTAGIHIHISRAAFGKPGDGGRPYHPAPYHLYKFHQFFFICEQLVKQVAGRTSAISNGHENASYNKEDVGYHRRLSDDGRRVQPDTDGFIRDIARGKQTSVQRYVAVNTIPAHTVEVRVFRSTMNHKRLRADVQFVDAVFWYTKKARLHSKKDPGKEISEEGFRRFVERYPAKYHDLNMALVNHPDYVV